MAKYNFKHGLTRTRFYRIWRAMKQRCGEGRYKNIQVCKEWLVFENFKRDMYESYKDGLTLDRIDGNKNYYKENCRWATYKEQNNNRKDNKWFTYKGLTKTLNQWAEFIGVKPSTMRQRFYVYKWSLDRCLKEVNFG